MDVLVNKQVGEFVLDQPIGNSDVATVYRAYQPALNRYVALKVITMQIEPVLGDTALFERRFTQEAEVLTSLEHPHIVPIYHYGVVEQDSAYIAMRLMHGSLQDRLNDGPLPPERVVDIALQLIDGLNYAHKKGVIHHDIKPANILFDEAGSACLTDFGLSNVTNQSIDAPRLNMLLNTAIYAAPEQIRNASTDHRADIYSLGMIMYQMLTGRLPFDTENMNIVSLLRKIENEEPLPPRSINPEIPIEIERVVLQALRKEPRERFFDAGEMVEALQAVPHIRQNVQPNPSISMRLPAIIKRPVLLGRTRILFSAVVLITLIALLLLLTNVARENSTPRLPTVIAQAHGSFTDAAPTSSEIIQARQRLGAKGFIAYIACSLDSQFQATFAREMSDFANAYQLRYQFYDSGNDGYNQLTVIERARLEGARAIILCPLKPALLAESLTSLRRAGIPLVLTNAISNSYGGVMIDPDDYATGKRAGEYVGETLAATLETARIVILDAPDYPFSEERAQGFLDGLSDHLRNVEIVGRFPTGADRAASESAISSFLSEQTVDAIFSVTDSGAYGVSAALAAAGVAPDSVVVASVNAESLALDEIEHGGYLRASVDIARESSSRGALDAAVKLLGGGTLPGVLDLPASTIITRDMIEGQSSSESP
ncbi:MAG: substrate-binding domain-containing protein [Chloroflexota bacterium]